MSLEKIKKILSRYKSKIKKMFAVKEIGIFGSYVRGEQRKNSDLDVLVEFKEVPGLLKFLKLENYLSEILGIKVDLIRKKAIREELRDRILNEAIYI